MSVAVTDVIVSMICVALLHAILTFEQSGCFDFPDATHGLLKSNRSNSLRVLSLTVLLDIPGSAHKCNQHSSFFSAKATIKVAQPKSVISNYHLERRGVSTILFLESEVGAEEDFLMLNYVNVTSIRFTSEGATYSINMRYTAEVGDYPKVGLVRTSCSRGKWPEQSAIMTYYGGEYQMENGASIIPAVSSDINDYLITVSIKEKGMRRVFSNAVIMHLSVSEESENVIQMTYNAQRLPHGIIFSIGIFKYEARSIGGTMPIRVVCATRTSSRIIIFIMNEVYEMASAMEENFGENLVNGELSFLMVPGTNVIKSNPYIYLIGTENPAYRSIFVLWKLVREAVALKWFISHTASPTEKMAVGGVVSFLVASHVGETRRKRNEGWVSVALGEQLSNSLPSDVDKRMTREGTGTKMNVATPEHVVEILASLIGKDRIYEILNTFLRDVRQRRNASLLKTLDRVFLREEKDWCGRPFNVTDFFIRWIKSDWPISGVSLTQSFLHVVIDDRRNSPILLTVNRAEDENDYPPIPLIMRLQYSHNESVIWKSQECGITFPVEKEYLMTLIERGDTILRLGSPTLLRLTYEEVGSLSYSTLTPKIYLNRITLPINEQLIFVADRLHVLLTKSWSSDYKEIIRLMDAFLKYSEDTAMFILLLPMIDRLYKIMVATDHEHIFTKYIFHVLEVQYSSLWWRDSGDSRKNLHRRILFPLTVRWNFPLARQEAMDLFTEVVSRGSPLNPNNHRLVELAESVFCAAVKRGMNYFSFFHEAVTNTTDHPWDEDTLYDEIIRSLACTKNEMDIASLVSALFVALTLETGHRSGRIVEQYIAVLGNNALSEKIMLDRLLKDESAAHLLYRANLLRPYLTAMTNFCYTYRCLMQISRLHSTSGSFRREITEMYTECSDMVFRRTSHIRSIILDLVIAISMIEP